MSLLLISPFRPPHWRSLRINEFLAPASTLRLSRKRDDDLVWRAVRFIRKRDRLRTERGRADWREQNSDVAMALDLINTDAPVGIEIRARTLARQTDAEIAEAVGAPAGVVRDYVGLRFDIRERLHARSFVVNEVIRLWDSPIPNAQQLLFLQAFLHGPHAVNGWLDWLAHQDEQRDLTTDTGRTRAAIDLYVQVQQTDFADFDHKSLLRNFDLIANMNAQHYKQSQQDGGFSEFVSQNLTRFVKTNFKNTEIASVISSNSDEKTGSGESVDLNRLDLPSQRTGLQVVQRDAINDRSVRQRPTVMVET